MPLTLRTRPRDLLPAAALGLVAITTLRPVQEVGPALRTFSPCLPCGAFGVADLIANLLLFVPLGLSLGWRRTGTWRWVLAGAGVSLGVELLQWGLLPGRAATLADLAANTTGTWLGVVAARWSPSAARWRALGYAISTAVVGLAAAAALLLRPAPLPTHRLFGQVAHDFGNTVELPGRVLEFTVAGVAVGDGPIAPGTAAELARRWGTKGSLLTARFALDEPASARSQIAGLEDGAVPPPAGFWVEPRQVEAGLRWGAARWRLRGPALRASLPAPAGDFSVALRWDRQGARLDVEGSSGRKEVTVLRTGWSTSWLLVAPAMRAGGLAVPLGSTLWLLIPTLLAGAAAALGTGTVRALWWPAVAAGLALGVIPVLAGLAPSPAMEWGTAAAGLLAGWWFGIMARRRARPASGSD